MNIVLCEAAEKREYTAGNKARTDVVRILMESGYKHISLFISKSNIISSKGSQYKRQMKKSRKNIKGD